MAVPKKRTGASAQGHRRSNWKATKPATGKCTNCGELVLSHTVCTACGYYKGEPVRLADKLAKSAPKAAPKAEKVTKAAVETEEKVEEVKTKATKAKAANKTETAEEIKKIEKKPQKIQDESKE